ncbi:MAG: acetyl-CoA synthase subunit gamma [Nitrospirae bacterium]|nr:acetyl-CoA synthase subunit gamma [Nitrospirota bacterium]
MENLNGINHGSGNKGESYVLLCRYAAQAFGDGYNPQVFSDGYGTQVVSGARDAQVVDDVYKAICLYTYCRAQRRSLPQWVTGAVMSKTGIVPKVATRLTAKDHWEHVMCRVSAFRLNYSVQPGLYAVGEAGDNSEVLVTANYKYSFDLLRQSLDGLSAWILVLDTGGINVWCAAGKGTFGTDELVRRIEEARLSELVTHRHVIVPQLGAPGVKGYAVQSATGFSVLFGPVYARDVVSYIKNGYQATRQMRTVNFTFIDRLILTPMEIIPAIKKYFIFSLFILVFFGLGPTGIIFNNAIHRGLPFLLLGAASIIAGALLSPILLPYVPFRSFAAKGWVVGLVVVHGCVHLISQLVHMDKFLLAASYVFFPMASSFFTLQFTGSTTFTGLSGVKKELKYAIIFYVVMSAITLVALIIYKVNIWRF